ncbi:unnamed protein product [Meloidogyne enterolobii]|uniref:Uncharacterized protein n=1 Tax=Meloidogyne enterolobii TaxID=390850 RepID=A0ACB0XNW1_MELEN
MTQAKRREPFFSLFLFIFMHYLIGTFSAEFFTVCKPNAPILSKKNIFYCEYLRFFN